MNTTEVRSKTPAVNPDSPPMNMQLQVVVVPVSNVDEAKRFYQSLGWQLDADYVGDDEFRIVQLTPPGSACSIIIGTGVTSATPGSMEGLLLAVDDVKAAQEDLIARGVEVSDVFHDAGGVFHHIGDKDRVPGPDPARRAKRSLASFNDPDGNGWILQEVPKL